MTRSQYTHECAAPVVASLDSEAPPVGQSAAVAAAMKEMEEEIKATTVKA